MRVFFLVLFLHQIGLSQNGFFVVPDVTANVAVIKDVLVDNDTIVMYGGISLDSLSGRGQFFFKYDTLGNMLKTSKIIADSVRLNSSDIGNLVKSIDGGYVILGAYRIYNQDSTHFVVYTYLLKVKHDLSLDFIKFYENPGYKNTLNQQLVVHKNGYMLFCVEQKAGENGANWFVRYVDTAGEVIWEKSYYKPASYNSIYDVAILESNEIVIFGNSTANMPEPGGGYENGFIYPIMMAIDTLGNVKWKWNWNGNKTGLRDLGQSFIAIKGGGFLYSGAKVITPTEGNIYAHPQLTQLDSSLNITWRYEIDSLNNQDNRMPSIIETPDSNYIVSGGFRDYIYHGKFRLNGEHIWERKDSTWTDEYTYHRGSVKKSALLSSGSIVSAGYMRNPDKNFADWSFVMKLSPDGCMDTLICLPVALDDDVQGVESQLDVYPNPATDVVHFSLSQDILLSAKKKIVITDLAGRMVKEIRYEGREVEWDLSLIPQGLYFYRLEVDGVLMALGSGSGKIVVLDE